VTLPPSAVTEISYGQDVHRRIGAAIGLALVSFGIGALMALTKSKKHFVGLTWTTHDDTTGIVVRIRRLAHAGDHLIGMVHQPWPWIPFYQSFVERCQGQSHCQRFV